MNPRTPPDTRVAADGYTVEAWFQGRWQRVGQLCRDGGGIPVTIPVSASTAPDVAVVLARLEAMTFRFPLEPNVQALLTAVCEVLDICELKEQVAQTAGRPRESATVFTANIRSRIAEALGI